MPSWVDVAGLQRLTDFFIFMLCFFLEAIASIVLVAIPVLLMRALILYLIRKGLL